MQLILWPPSPSWLLSWFALPWFCHQSFPVSFLPQDLGTCFSHITHFSFLGWRLRAFHALHDPLARAPSMSPSSLQIQTKRGLMLFPFIALSFPPCHVICVHGMEDLFASSVSATVLFVMNTGNICFAHHYIFSLLVLITSFMPQLYSWNVAGGPHIFIL